MTSRALRSRAPKVTISRSVRDTEKAGARLASRLEPGDCVRLTGPLGAGKTSFVRGALRALGVKRRAISPTFTLAHESVGRLPGSGRVRRGAVPVAHLDFYRLEGRAEERGLLDYLDGRFVVFVEWADRDSSYRPANTVTVRISSMGGNRRRIRIGRGR